MIQLVQVSGCLIAGLLMTRFFKALKLHFPDVTAFLITGVLIGPYFLGRLGIRGLGFTNFDEIEALDVLNSAALGFIAFSIGNEFRLSQLKEIGKKAFVIGIFQALVASLLVDIALVSLHFILGPDILSLPAAITLGAIAAATAPAATLMVVRQYKAQGPVTRLLLPIVALDDAVGLVVFAVSFGIARAMEDTGINVFSVLVDPIVEIIASLVLGAVLGYVLNLLEKLFFSNTNRLAMVIAFVLLTIALSSREFKIGEVTVGFSSLLVCMMLGTVLCNLCPHSEDIMSRADRWTVPLNTLFFVLSGAALELGVFKNPKILLVGVLYVLVRSIGKYVGASSSAAFMKCRPQVIKYLGITLFPQAGVALGMCDQATALGGESAVLVRNVVLFSVLVYEMVGPQLTRMALTAAGEIHEKQEHQTSLKRFEKT